ncbi:MAG: ABC transporter substrate-binding protein [Limimaricola soesokkakensis]|uniref:ABC transporter substrate-binding protein n=1 Tax=Limimaricola soesokkakensis TaxID=1343159 RepID=UPI0040587806
MIHADTRKLPLRRLLAASAMAVLPATAMAAELEITHWWTSGGEAAAVRELATAFEAGTDHTWVDGAIAGSGGTARPIIISRILGGDPMAATQLNHGQQAQELVEAGMMLDLTELAEEGNWAELVQPKSLLDACTFEGRVYCVPLNIHSPQWMWTSIKAFEKAGVEPAQNWEELKAAAPALREAGVQPLIEGLQAWQFATLFQTLVSGLGGEEVYYGVYRDGDEAVLRGEEMAMVFEEAVAAREMLEGTNVQDWNLATAAVINGEAAANVMGDWAQGEFQVAGQVAGQDYDCLMGLGGEPLISTGGDAFYFPANDDEAITEGQKDLARLLISPEAQIAFNTKKGSLPVRGDVDLAEAGVCMQKGLEALKAGKVIDSVDMLISPDVAGQVGDLLAEFFASDMSAEEAQERFAEVILSDN